MEEAPGASEQKYRDLADSLPQLIYEIDLTGRLTFVNQGGLELFRVTPEDFERGVQVLDFVVPEDRERAAAGIGRRAAGWPHEEHWYTFLRKDGTTFHGTVRANPILQDGRPVGLRGYIVDVTGYQEVQARLVEQEKALAHLEAGERVAAAEERLRRQIAELLHGPVQTKLLVAWFRLGECQSLLSTDPAAAAALLEEVRGEIDRVREQDVRQASHLLYPAILGVGLVPALRSLMASFQAQLTLDLQVDPALAQLDTPVDNRIPEPLRLAAYRVVEEALNNVCRHARAASAQISLGLDAQGRLTLAVKDDGVGFDTSQIKRGLGLGSISGRVDQAGGQWQISSAPGQGTRLSVTLPLR